MKPLRVLIVDDDRDFGQSLANFLRLEGHQVDLAFDGAHSCRALKEFM